MPPLSSPNISRDKIPKAERKYAYFIETTLNYLALRCTELDAAIALFETCAATLADSQTEIRAKQLAWNWQFMSAREAVSAVFKFSEDMEMIGVNLSKCPVLLRLVDSKAKRVATRKFKTAFPGIIGIRHSGQHGDIIYGSPEKLAKHVTGPIISINNLVGNTIETTYKRKKVSLEISGATLTKLEQVRDAYWDAFWHLDPFGGPIAQ